MCLNGPVYILYSLIIFADILHMLIGFLVAQIVLSAVAIQCGSKWHRWIVKLLNIYINDYNQES